VFTEFRRENDMLVRLIISVFLITLAGAVAMANDAPPATENVVTAATTAAPAWLAEVREILAERDADRSRLEREFNNAIDETAALAIQRRMQELEETTELKIMNVQLAHLRQAGRVEEADSLAEMIREMTEPRPARDATPRPRADEPGRR
jgi:membrane-bound lytic murein transglycosylase B